MEDTQHQELLEENCATWTSHTHSATEHFYQLTNQPIIQHKHIINQPLTHRHTDTDQLGPTHCPTDTQTNIPSHVSGGGQNTGVVQKSAGGEVAGVSL